MADLYVGIIYINVLRTQLNFNKTMSIQTEHVTAYKATVCQQPDYLVIRK